MAPVKENWHGLVERGLPLMQWVLNRSGGEWGRYGDEMRSAAALGLVVAARTYDHSRGNKFVTHAVRVIRREVSRALEKVKRQEIGAKKRGWVWDHDAAVEGLDSSQAADYRLWLKNPTDPEAALRDWNELVEWCRLDPREVELLTLRYAEELSVHQIARKRKVAVRKVKRKLYSILAKCRNRGIEL